MNVEDPVGPTVEEGSGEDAHETGQHDHLRARGSDCICEALFPAGAIGPVEGDGLSQQTGSCSPLERRRISHITEDPDQVGSHVTALDRIHEGDQVATGTGGEDSDPRPPPSAVCTHRVAPIILPARAVERASRGRQRNGRPAPHDSTRLPCPVHPRAYPNRQRKGT